MTKTRSTIKTTAKPHDHADGDLGPHAHPGYPLHNHKAYAPPAPPAPEDHPDHPFHEDPLAWLDVDWPPCAPLSKPPRRFPKEGTLPAGHPGPGEVR